MPDRQDGRRFLTGTSDLLRHPAASWFVIAVTAVVVIFLAIHPQAPGVAIGLLAVVSVVMTVARATAPQKLVFVGLAVVLLVLESISISIDRDAQDKKASSTLKEMLDANNKEASTILQANAVATRKILKSAAESFVATQDALAKSQTKLTNIIDADKSLGTITARNLSVSNENLNNLTGGSSHPFIMPFRGVSDQVELSIWNIGRYTLTGVSIDVLHASKPLEKHGEYEIGTIPAGQIRRTGIVLPGPYPKAPGWDEYFVTAYAQNGAIVQLMDFREGRGAMPWAYRIAAHHIVPGSTAMGESFVPKGMPANYTWSDDPPDQEPPK